MGKCEATRCFPNSVEFGMHGTDLTYEPLSPWAEMMDLPKLQRLTIAKCPGADGFVTALARRYPGRCFHLEHLALDLDSGKALSTALKSCLSITSLHVNTSYPLHIDATSDKLKAHRSSIRTLALNRRDLDHGKDGFTDSTFMKLCEACYNVQYFGIHLVEDHMALEFALDSELYGFLPRIEVLCTLRQLRVIHCRLPLESPPIYEYDETGKTPRLVDWEMLRFCNAIFGYMEERRACPSLKAIIVGQWFEAGDAREGVGYPRHCFIRGYQTDLLNRKTAVAVPVPAYRTRELKPECDLLDFDPMGVWVGGTPRRVHRF